MIRLTDTTLTHIPSIINLDNEKILRFCELLVVAGVDFVELPVSLLENAEPLASVLRIQDPRLIYELQVNDIREINRLHNVHSLQRVRVKGLDDVLLKNYSQVFAQLQTYLGKEYEFCPQNSYGLATAAGVEWVNTGGSRLVTSFGGIGNCAPTEEVLMALRINKRHHPNHDLSVMPELKNLFEEMTDSTFSSQKPILGSQIFCVEAGIHADGIDKNPYSYEPFQPQSVGTRRTLVVGKHSGTKAISIKLSQLQIPHLPEEIPEILLRVQAESTRLRRSLSDQEFEQLVETARKAGRL